MSSWARVGMKVVCIKKGEWKTVIPGRDNGIHPKYGDVCEITGFDDRNGSLCLAGYISSYNPSRFRPLVTKSQEDDISMFKSLLKPTEVPA